MKVPRQHYVNAPARPAVSGRARAGDVRMGASGAPSGVLEDAGVSRRQLATRRVTPDPTTTGVQCSRPRRVVRVFSTRARELPTLSGFLGEPRPTQGMRQGNDVAPVQSGIYVYTTEQRRSPRRTHAYQPVLVKAGTSHHHEILDAPSYYAEEYHQHTSPRTGRLLRPRRDGRRVPDGALPRRRHALAVDGRRTLTRTFSNGASRPRGLRIDLAVIGPDGDRADQDDDHRRRRPHRDAAPRRGRAAAGPLRATSVGGISRPWRAVTDRRSSTDPVRVAITTRRRTTASRCSSRVGYASTGELVRVPSWRQLACQGARRRSPAHVRRSPTTGWWSRVQASLSHRAVLADLDGIAEHSRGAHLGQRRRPGGGTEARRRAVDRAGSSS